MKDINTRVNEFCNQSLDWLCKIYDVTRSEMDFEFDYDNHSIKVIMFTYQGKIYNLDVAYSEENFYSVAWTFRNISDVVNLISEKFSLKERVVGNILTFVVLNDDKLVTVGHTSYIDNKVTQVNDVLNRIYEQLWSWCLRDISNLHIQLLLVNSGGVVLDSKNFKLGLCLKEGQDE